MNFSDHTNEVISILSPAIRKYNIADNLGKVIKKGSLDMGNNQVYIADLERGYYELTVLSTISPKSYRFTKF